MQAGAVLDGKYKIIRALGIGSVGEVYEAEHQLMGKRVAVKVLHANLSADNVVRSRFFAEAQAASRLGHLNIVNTYDLGITPSGEAYMTMEYLEGETLDQVLEQEGGISAAFACEIMVQALSALQAAHQQGVVHADLKPSNIMITYPRPKTPVVKVLDFGIARGIHQFDAKPVTRRLLLEPPLYMAPEVALARPFDARVDIYSAAAVLYKMLTDEPPFPASTTRELVEAMENAKPVPIRNLNSKHPMPLCQAVERALSLDPGRRTGDAQKLADEILPYSESGIREGAAPPASAAPDEPEPPDSFRVMTSPKPTPGALDRENRWNLSFGPPRRDSRLTPSLLIDPRFPRAPGAPRFESFVPRTSRLSELDTIGNATISPAVDGKSTKQAIIATACGFGIGAILAWLSAML